MTTTATTSTSPASSPISTLLRDRVAKIRLWLATPAVVDPDRLTLSQDGSGRDRSVLFEPNRRIATGLVCLVVGTLVTMFIAAQFATGTAELAHRIVVPSSLSSPAQDLVVLLAAAVAFLLPPALAVKILLRSEWMHANRSPHRSVYCPAALTDAVERTTHNLSIIRTADDAPVLARRFQAVISGVTGVREADTERATVDEAAAELAEIDRECSNLSTRLDD